MVSCGYPEVLLDCPLLLDKSFAAPAVAQEYSAAPFGSPIKPPRKRKVETMHSMFDSGYSYPFHVSAGEEIMDEERECRCLGCTTKIEIPNSDGEGEGVDSIVEAEKKVSKGVVYVSKTRDEAFDIRAKELQAQLDFENERDAEDAQATANWTKFKDLASSAVPCKHSHRAQRLCDFNLLVKSMSEERCAPAESDKKVLYDYLKGQADHDAVESAMRAYYYALQLADRAHERPIGAYTGCEKTGLAVAINCAEGMAGERAAQLACISAREAMKMFEGPRKEADVDDKPSIREADIAFLRQYTDLDYAVVMKTWPRWMPAAGPGRGSQRFWTPPVVQNARHQGESSLVGGLVDTASKVKSCVGGFLRSLGAWKK